MSRPVTADHILFRECIPVFRPPDLQGLALTQRQEPSYGYLLLDFESAQALDLEHFTILPTQKVEFPRAQTAFVAPVTLPSWVEGSQGHLFTTVLAAVVSFAVRRPASSPRDSYISGHPLSERDLQCLGVQFPVLIAGPGAHVNRLSQQSSQQLYQVIQEVVSVVFALPHESYERFVKAVRLVQLAHLNRRQDFALAYFLLVAAIESIATLAVSRNAVKDRPSNEPVWRKIAASNQDIKELLDAYLELRGHNKYLGCRFVEFILSYCPVSSWSQMPHPLANTVSHLEETTEGQDLSWLTDKKSHEVYPSDLPIDLPESSPVESEKYTIRRILSDTYRYRSRFAHEGESPPHRSPISHNKYLDLEFAYNRETQRPDQILLLNLDLISFIAKHSILSYAKGRAES